MQICGMINSTPLGTRIRTLRLDRGLSLADLWARNLAVAALVLALVLMISPFAMINVLASPLSRLAVLAFVFCLCTALLQRLGRGDRGYAITLQVLRVLIPLVTVAAAVFATIDAPAGLPVEWLYPVQLIGTAVLAVVMWALGSRYSFSR